MNGPKTLNELEVTRLTHSDNTFISPWAVSFPVPSATSHNGSHSSIFWFPSYSSEQVVLFLLSEKINVTRHRNKFTK